MTILKDKKCGTSECVYRGTKENYSEQHGVVSKRTTAELRWEMVSLNNDAEVCEEQAVPFIGEQCDVLN